MIFTIEERMPESPYVESISHGITTAPGTVIHPAENSWYMVLLRRKDNIQLLVTGPKSGSGIISFDKGGELLWIRFRVGIFMPHLSVTQFINLEKPLPGAASNSFWLKGSAWQFPTYENTDLFVDKLVRQEIIVRDPVVSAVLQGQPHELTPRTVRHRFLRATGQSYKHIWQVERAQQAAHLLRSGTSILDTVEELDYYDQPHLTRSLKQFVGYTPAQLLPAGKICHFIQDEALSPQYNTTV